MQSSQWNRKWQPTPFFLPGKFPRQRSLVGYGLCSHKESDMIERLSTHIVFSIYHMQTAKKLKHRTSGEKLLPRDTFRGWMNGKGNQETFLIFVRNLCLPWWQHFLQDSQTKLSPNALKHLYQFPLVTLTNNHEINSLKQYYLNFYVSDICVQHNEMPLQSKRDRFVFISVIKYIYWLKISKPQWV